MLDEAEEKRRVSKTAYAARRAPRFRRFHRRVAGRLRENLPTERGRGGDDGCVKRDCCRKRSWIRVSSFICFSRRGTMESRRGLRPRCTPTAAAVENQLSGERARRIIMIFDGTKTTRRAAARTPRGTDESHNKRPARVSHDTRRTTGVLTRGRGFRCTNSTFRLFVISHWQRFCTPTTAAPAERSPPIVCRRGSL